MAPALAPKKLYTIHDIYNLPEGSRAELIDGQIYYMAPPTRKHQRIAGEIFAAIHEYINTHNGSCEVDIAPFAVFLGADDINYVEPDISVICDPDKLTDKGCSGVREYWIVDPDRNRITIYDFESEDIRDYTFADSVKVNIFNDLYISFSDIAKSLNI